MRLSENRWPASTALPRCSTTTRRSWIVALAALAGCRRAARPIEQLFPAELAGARLTEVRRLPLEALSADLRRFRVRQAARATYAGGQPLRVELYEMANPKTAYAMVRLAHGGLPFFHGDYFGILEAPGAAPAALETYRQALLREMR